ncbi:MULTISPECIES: hypothetical protein [Subtercola]|uniref:Uncharacterized protein n=1 Tax=Subtercola vilae TaxID=2056433 RepID=A0A4T2CBV7_9MICO|nr:MULTISPECIES: hypothetical protein [Subtercola]MEA9985882.1 hypothetical protein [Subtercola sp. RTI3]TIH40166.1 hypothetical protein D4765_03330 [Subtercola vilae]
MEIVQVAITSSAARTFRSFSARVLAILAIAAALMGLFALHAMTDHDTMTSGSMSAGISHADPAGAMTDPAPITTHLPAGAVVPVAAAAAALALPLFQEMSMANMQGCPGCAMQCAIYAMNCVILIVLSLLVLFGRFPMTGSAGRLAVPVLLHVLHAARRCVLRPSLIALSISRT